MSAVWSNQKRDSPVRTRPLSGIGVGRTTSNARQPVAGHEQQPIADLEQVAHLARPDESARGGEACARRRADRRGSSSQRATSAASFRAGTRSSRRAMAVGTLRRKWLSSKQAARRLVGEAGGDVRVGGEQVAQLARARRRPAASCAGRPRRPPRATGPPPRRGPAGRGCWQWRPRPRSMFSRIRSGRTTRPLDQAARLHEHVVEQDRGVGEQDPLGADEWLMSRSCQSGWFSRAAAGVAAQEARHPGDPLATGSGCACGASPSCPSGRPGTAPSARRSRCAGGCGPRWRSARGEPPVIAIAARSAAWRSRWTICVVTGSRCRPSVGQDLRLQVRVEVAVRARPARRSCRWPTSSTAAARRRPVAVDLEGPARELEAQRGRLGVDRVGPAHHHRAGLGAGAGDERRDQRVAGRSSRRRPAAWSWSASAVSTTSLLVRPRWR